ncbi:hypothetical protein RJ55_04442 [Drechmeria coniospora]|nr:hypothetical protein RJ55_04442 [Drechmeria coniospora]
MPKVRSKLSVSKMARHILLEILLPMLAAATATTGPHQGPGTCQLQLQVRAPCRLHRLLASLQMYNSLTPAQQSPAAVPSAEPVRYLRQRSCQPPTLAGPGLRHGSEAQRDGLIPEFILVMTLVGKLASGLALPSFPASEMLPRPAGVQEIMAGVCGRLTSTSSHTPVV